METKKVLGIIFSLVFIGAFIFVLTWGIINFNKVKDGMSGTGVYTQEDIDNAYEDGYNTALENKSEYDELINSYRDTITTLTDNVSQLNSQINILTNNNKDYKEQVSYLEEQKANLQTQVDNLTSIKNDNEASIESLNSQISILQNQIESLTNSGENKDEQISQLNKQVANLQSLVNQLQETNQMNVNTISNLNVQISNLNRQISEMTELSQNANSQINILNNKINELQKSIKYYEEYIASLESGEQVVATFEFDGSVYNIQIVNKNSILSVTPPTSTEYKIFNGWTVNGESVDLSTYTITTNTKFVADVTYKYDVKFMVDSNEYNSQIIVKNGFATLPEEPTKAGYEFSGWSLNGIDIIDNISTTPITQNIAYIAVFTKLHTVTFMNGDNIYETQYVKNGNFATNVIIENEGNKIFKGWKVNDILVDISTYQILSDTIFVADFAIAKTVEFYLTYSSFSPEQNVLYETKYVEENNFVELPTPPEKEGYVFKGWCDATVLFGETIIDLSNYPITADMKLRPAWEQYKTLKFYVGEELFHSVQVLDGDYIEPFESPVNSTNLNADWIYFNSVFMGASTKKIFDFNEPVNTSLYEYDMLDMSYKFYWHTYETLENIHLSSENNVITYSNENFNKEILNDYGILDMSIDFTYTINGNIISRSYNFGLNTELCYDTRNEYKLTDLLVHNSYALYLVITFNTDGEIVFTLNYSGASQPVFTSLTINNFTYIVE